MSSSAVDLSLMFNRVMVLVKHGIENAFEAFKKGFHTTSLVPITVPSPSADQSFLPDFLGATAAVIKSYRGLCAELCNAFFVQYCDKIAEPLEFLKWHDVTGSMQMSTPFDEAFIAQYPLPLLCTLINDVLFCKNKILDLQVLPCRITAHCHPLPKGSEGMPPARRRGRVISTALLSLNFG